MKPKRRPLPADPSGLSSLPQTPPQSLPTTPQRYVEGPDGNVFVSPPPLGNQIQHSPHASSQDPPFNSPYNGNGTPFDEIRDPENPQQYGHGLELYGQQDPTVLSQSPQNEYHDQNPLHDPSYELPSTGIAEGYTSGDPRLGLADLRGNIDPQLLNQPQRLSMVHSDPLPSVFDMNAYPKSPLSKQSSYDNTPTRRSPLRESSVGTWPNAETGTMPEDAPPPPPQHRHSGSRSALQSAGRDPYGTVPVTAPLNIRHDRGESFSNSPLSQVQSTTSSAVSAMSTSPSSKQQYPHHGSVSSMSSYDILHHRRSQSPVREWDRTGQEYGDAMPPSLTPGYDPTIAADESERLVREQRIIGQQAAQGPMPQYQQAAAVPIQQPRAKPIPRGFESIDDRRELREHRYSAPIPPAAAVGRSQPVSADPRIPMRKPLSPQPASGPTDRRHSEVPSQIPFGPDSFDVYNPTVGSANSVYEMGARYNTPEEATEATFQHEKRSKLGDGPIIGNDGRIIDPSDHLPSDTWAPEPEQKPAKRKPEVTIRFKHSQQGAQPMAQDARQPSHEARPSALPPRTYQQSHENLPNPTFRTRLQKKPRPGMVQPNSSPLTPTINTSPRNVLPRMPVSEYPLRENGNPISYGNSSPMYGYPSQGGLAPPIPGKVPIGTDQEDWGGSALSEEMRRIDIGVGGRSPPRRARYSTRDV